MTVQITKKTYGQSNVIGRLSEHIINGKKMIVDHTRRPTTVGSWPTHKGWCVRHTKNKIIGPDAQQAFTTYYWCTGSREDIAEFCNKLEKNEICDSDIL